MKMSEGYDKHYHPYGDKFTGVQNWTCKKTGKVGSDRMRAPMPTDKKAPAPKAKGPIEAPAAVEEEITEELMAEAADVEEEQQADLLEKILRLTYNGPITEPKPWNIDYG